MLNIGLADMLNPLWGTCRLMINQYCSFFYIMVSVARDDAAKHDE